MRENFDKNSGAPQSHALHPGLEPALVVQRKDSLNYKKWMVTRDNSVYPATQREIIAALGLSEEDRKEWNSDGIELVSKTYHYDDIDSGCQKLARYLAQFRYVGTVKPGQRTPADSDGEEDDSAATIARWHSSTNDGMDNEMTWGAFDTVFAGTHVHIGLDWVDEKGVDLDFLRHLSFLIISNEQLISSLHAFKRRGKLTSFTPVEDVFTPITQRTGSEKELARVTELKEKYVTQHCLISNESSFLAYTGSLPRVGTTTPEIQQEAANFFFNPNLTTKQLFENVQKQGRGGEPYHGVLVDLHRLAKRDQWTRLSPGEREGTTPPICTIEFRQHGCTLDADEVKHWVKFLFALVRLAEKRAQQTTDYFDAPLKPAEGNSSLVEQQMAKYSTAPFTVEAFCSAKNLDLPQDEIDYWKARVDQYADSQKTYFATTEERRRRRRERKSRFGLRLTEAERQALAAAPDASQYQRMNKEELRAMIKERLGTDFGREIDERRITRLNSKRKRDLVRMAGRMDRNLRQEGTYVPDGASTELP